nr:hypothetical protein [Tanacetum cinerariifolium]
VEKSFGLPVMCLEHPLSFVHSSGSKFQGMEHKFLMACNFEVGSYSKLREIHLDGFVVLCFFSVEMF